LTVHARKAYYNGLTVDTFIYLQCLTWKELELSARQLGVQLHSLEVRNANELDNAFDAAIQVCASALFVVAAPLIESNLQRVALLAAKHGLPSIYHSVRFANVGGLVTYGPDPLDIGRGAAAYVDKIFKGAKPGDLPIEQPTTFKLVINLKTAKAIGLTIPQNVLFRANRVIE
jgi:putative tryptophan/tyrosine transport system substrate-binding protein